MQPIISLSADTICTPFQITVEPLTVAITPRIVGIRIHTRGMSITTLGKLNCDKTFCMRLFIYVHSFGVEFQCLLILCVHLLQSVFDIFKKYSQRRSLRLIL